MKIGIVTFHDANNYGAVLQAYALQETIKNLSPNAEVYIYDYKCKFVLDCYKVWYFSWDLSKSFYLNIRHLLGNLYRVIKSLPYIKSIKKRNTVFDFFRKKYLHISSDSLNTFDEMIFGSDQIWSPYTSGDDLFYFGDGVSCKKYSYGLSDGGNLVLDDIKNNLIRDFKYISCREKKLEEKIRLELNFDNVNLVCDPVFLLNGSDWEKIVELPEEDNYILIYKIAENDSIYEEAYKLSRKTNLKIIAIDYVKMNRTKLSKKFGIDFVYGLSPTQFIGYIKKASYIITTSFHGTAFSIIFEKNFFVLKFDVAADRIENLLDKMELSNRYVKNIDNTSSLDISYTDMHRIRFNEYVSLSRNYLTQIVR